MLDPNTLTEKSRLALVGAQEQAVGHDHPQVEPLHILDSLLQQGEGIGITRVLAGGQGDGEEVFRAVNGKG